MCDVRADALGSRRRLNLSGGLSHLEGMNRIGTESSMVAGPRRASDAADPKRECFERLTQNRLDRAYRLASALLRDSVEAEDAVSEAAILAWTHWRQLRDPDHFDGWFDRILVNECRRRLRLRRPQSIPEPRAAGHGEDATGAVTQRDALRRVLMTLSADHRIVLVLRFVEDLSLREIAERTRQREGTVKSRLHYALRSLRAAYAAEERGRGVNGE